MHKVPNISHIELRKPSKPNSTQELQSRNVFKYQIQVIQHLRKQSHISQSDYEARPNPIENSQNSLELVNSGILNPPPRECITNEIEVVAEPCTHIVEAEEHEVLVVVKSHTVGNSRAVVIHLQNTFFANSAVM